MSMGSKLSIERHDGISFLLAFLLSFVMRFSCVAQTGQLMWISRIGEDKGAVFFLFFQRKIGYRSFEMSASCLIKVPESNAQLCRILSNHLTAQILCKILVGIPLSHG